MRTTLTLPDEVYEVARSLASLRRISLGEAVGELVKRGLTSARGLNSEKAFPCFVVSESAKPITLEQTLEAEDEP